MFDDIVRIYAAIGLIVFVEAMMIFVLFYGRIALNGLLEIQKDGVLDDKELNGLHSKLESMKGKIVARKLWSICLAQIVVAKLLFWAFVQPQGIAELIAWLIYIAILPILVFCLYCNYKAHMFVSGLKK